MKEEFRMKKMVFSLALFLGGAGSVLAQVNADKVNHAVARNSKVNQMFVTTNAGDVKYYNTADLASVKFEGDKAIIAPKDGSDNDEYDASVREINFAKRVEQGENLNSDNSLVDCFEGRQVTPGHAIEAMWFIMDLGKRLGRQDLIEKAVQIALNEAEYGWDKKHGGIFYFMDRLGRPCQQLEWDQKLWWVHIETLITMLKGYQLTGNAKCLEWFERVHNYVWTHFTDKEYPEWFGYLNRQGEVLLSLKGGKWKGCFHVPRGLFQCWQILEDLAARS